MPIIQPVIKGGQPSVSEYISVDTINNKIGLGCNCVSTANNVYKKGFMRSYKEHELSPNTIGNFNSIKKITDAAQAFFEAFNYSKNIIKINFSNLVEISNAAKCFRDSFAYSDIAQVDFSSLCTINNSTECFWAVIAGTPSQNLTFPSLKNVNTSKIFPWVFQNTTGGTPTVFFPALNSNSFGSYTDQFYGMFYGKTGCVAHFPANLQSVIGSWSDVTDGFSGTDTTVLFDLPSTFILSCANSEEYERNPKYDTQSALAWRIKDTGITYEDIDFTPFYTTGTTDPQVGDTIYSDSACTTAVTTISSIA